MSQSLIAICFLIQSWQICNVVWVSRMTRLKRVFTRICLWIWITWAVLLINMFFFYTSSMDETSTKFDRWYRGWEGKEYVFKQQLHQYCKMDVCILRKCYLIFSKLIDEQVKGNVLKGSSKCGNTSQRQNEKKRALSCCPVEPQRHSIQR